MERAASPPQDAPVEDGAQAEDGRHLREGIRSRDEDAWRTLTGRYHHALLRTASRLLHRHADAEDAVCQALYRAFRCAERYEPSRSPYPWLATILYRECLRHRRDRRPVLPLARRFRRRDVRAPDPLDITEAAALLRKALLQLGPRERQVLTLRHLFGLSTAEVAEAVGIREASVYQDLTRAYHHLRAGPHAEGLRECWLRLAATPEDAPR